MSTRRTQGTYRAKWRIYARLLPATHFHSSCPLTSRLIVAGLIMSSEHDMAIFSSFPKTSYCCLIVQFPKCLVLNSHDVVVLNVPTSGGCVAGPTRISLLHISRSIWPGRLTRLDNYSTIGTQWIHMAQFKTTCLLTGKPVRQELQPRSHLPMLPLYQSLCIEYTC